MANKNKISPKERIKSMSLEGELDAKYIVKQIASVLGFSINEGKMGISAYGGNAIRLADHRTYMQTWVDNGTWNAPMRVGIVIEDVPTIAQTQVKEGVDFTITEIVYNASELTNELVRIIVFDILDAINGNAYADNARGTKIPLVATHSNPTKNTNNLE